MKGNEVACPATEEYGNNLSMAWEKAMVNALVRLRRGAVS
jgi:hypothetical protein